MKKVFSILFTFCLSLFYSLPSLQATEIEMQNQQRPLLEIETNQGIFDVVLWPDIAPKASENFLKHAEDGYYNDIIFHRVIKKFMIQGGDPTGTGRGGQSIWKAPFEDEFSPKATFDRPGLLAMANAGPKTNGSQFFITTASAPWLNNKHTIFGEVVKGYDVIQKIEATTTSSGDRPANEIKIIRIKVKNKNDLK